MMTEKKDCYWQKEDTFQTQMKQVQKQCSRMVAVTGKYYKVNGRLFLCSRNLVVREKKGRWNSNSIYLFSIDQLMNYMISLPFWSLTWSLFILFFSVHNNFQTPFSWAIVHAFPPAQNTLHIIFQPFWAPHFLRPIKIYFSTFYLFYAFFSNVK